MIFGITKFYISYIEYNGLNRRFLYCLAWVHAKLQNGLIGIKMEQFHTFKRHYKR